MTLRKIEPKSRKELHELDFDSKEKMFPTFSIENVHLPEAKDWEIGQEYHVLLKLKMTGFSNSKFQKNSDYDIIGIDPNAKGGSSHNSSHK